MAKHPPKTDPTPELNPDGWEVPNQTPLNLPLGFKRPETLAEQVQRLVRFSVSQYAASQGQETFEEADDFDCGDDSEPGSPYETFFDPVLGREITPAEFRAQEQRFRAEYVEAQRKYFESLDRSEVLRRSPSHASGREAPPSTAPRPDPAPRAAGTDSHDPQ